MPTYEYECERCGHRFERFQSITDEPVKRCPQCRGKVRRLLSGGAGFLFKGSGFYITDYSRKSQPSPSAGSTSKKEKPSSKGE